MSQLSDSICTSLIPQFSDELEYAYVISTVLLAVNSAGRYPALRVSPREENHTSSNLRRHARVFRRAPPIVRDELSHALLRRSLDRVAFPLSELVRFVEPT